MPGGQQQKHAELGAPWAVQYSPARSCHLVLGDGSGTFSLPPRAEAETNIWCNWTILGGPQKHLLVYIQGFQGTDGCAKNQDKIIFQGVLSRVETQAVYACHNRGTLIFATQAAALHIVLLASLPSQYGHFKGHYYVFRDSGTRGLSSDTMAPQEPVQEASKKASWRMAVTKDWLPTLRASPGPPRAPAGGKVQPELVSPTEEAQHPPGLLESAQSGANLSKLELDECGQLQDERELDRSLEDRGSEGAEGDVLVGLSPAQQGAEVSAAEPAEAELVSALLTCCPPASVPCPEVPSSSADVSATPPGLGEASASLLDEVASAAPGTQTPVLEEPLLTRNTKPAPLYPSPAVTAGGVTSPGEGPEELLDLLSALPSLENDTELQAQHHPGDVLFEVTAEINPQGWIPPDDRELQKGLLDSMKNYIQQNLKLPAKRVSEVKLKEIKRTSGANLLLRLWLQLKPEDRNLSALLHSQLQQLPGARAGPEEPQLVSLLVEDVDECGAGPSLCGEQAECFNRPGTYLCRCREGYEDRSPTRSGTSCVPAPRSGTVFLQYADILVGASLVAALAMLVAAGAMCRQRWSCRKSPSPEEPAGRAEEEPALELPALGECLRLDPFQLKLRARTPEWL
ncbi:uncharacterized protein LOC128899065 [Dryobates pubescens]|uniref:uncharacterized protein LOC128899065 n=1 Tax=Dryobates pubescens TaxID=118200 RepID=UPI0023B9ABC9|nr:uncharacterized protein LOC128899065 [Dryobates pubescens]